MSFFIFIIIAPSQYTDISDNMIDKQETNRLKLDMSAIVRIFDTNCKPFEPRNQAKFSH